MANGTENVMEKNYIVAFAKVVASQDLNYPSHYIFACFCLVLNFHSDFCFVGLVAYHDQAYRDLCAFFSFSHKNLGTIHNTLLPQGRPQ